ncbi:MAG: hypothetical protein H6841_01165 [Planctomycetes bacterium]|nr:hypothetical protein [Planctomycetota bacterium]
MKNWLSILLVGALCMAAVKLTAQDPWQIRSGWSVRQGHAAVSCNGRIWVLGGTDGVTPTNDVWSSADGVTWTLETPAAPWSARYEHSAVVFDNRLWVMGGMDATAAFLNDVWSSTDGVNWVQETAAAAWSPRRGTAVVEYAGSLWLLGGSEPAYGIWGLNDVWTSSDGVNWTQQANAPWPTRYNHSAVVFNGQIFVMAGQGGFQFKNDVWSFDGSSWISCTSQAWGYGGQRYGTAALAFNNKLWVCGGYAGYWLANGITMRDVWCSDDGISWTKQTSSAAWLPRCLHQPVVFNGSMWLLGGLTDSWLGSGWVATSSSRGYEANDAWYSSDGANWTQATADGGFNSWSARKNHTTETFNGRLWLMGGFSNGFATGDVWSTTGNSWTLETATAGWMARAGHTSAVFNSQLWVLGGAGGASSPILLNDVWSSADGVTWNQATSSAGWSWRSEHATVVFQGKLWVLGGRDYVGGLNDVWSSPDGVNWVQEAAAAPWRSRFGHTATVMDNRIWLMGGHDPATGADLGDVWSSADGVNWTQECAAAPWAARAGHAVAAVNSRLWLIGGHQINSSSTNFPAAPLDDVWSSADGINWAQEADLPFSPRSEHTLSTFNGEFWLMGGRYGRHALDISLSQVWTLALPNVQLGAGSFQVDEAAGTADILVQLNRACGFAVTVLLETANGTASAPGDYAPVTTMITIPAGQTSAIAGVPIVDDTLDEDDETVIVSINSPQFASLGMNSSASLLIVDDDASPQVRMSSATASVSEDDGVVTLAIELDAPSGRDVQVEFATQDGSAAAPFDYQSATGTVVIPAGGTAAQFSVLLVDDGVFENQEDFQVVLWNPLNATLGAQSVTTVSITDGKDGVKGEGNGSEGCAASRSGGAPVWLLLVLCAAACHLCLRRRRS